MEHHFFCTNTKTHFSETKYHPGTKKHFLVEVIYKGLSPNIAPNIK